MVRGYTARVASARGVASLATVVLLTLLHNGAISTSTATLTSALGSDPPPWVWLEAEEFADGNFPRASGSTRGRYCATCSEAEYLLFLPGAPGRPFDPPGYWYTDFALRVPEAADYRYVWMALSPTSAAFSWSVDAQSPIAATVLETASSYGEPTFRWVRLDPTGLDLTIAD